MASFSEREVHSGTAIEETALQIEHKSVDIRLGHPFDVGVSEDGKFVHVYVNGSIRPTHSVRIKNGKYFTHHEIENTENNWGTLIQRIHLFFL